MSWDHGICFDCDEPVTVNNGWYRCRACGYESLRSNVTEFNFNVPRDVGQGGGGAPATTTTGPKSLGLSVLPTRVEGGQR